MRVLVDAEVMYEFRAKEAGLEIRQDAAREVDVVIATRGAEALRLRHEALLDRAEAVFLDAEVDAQLAAELACVEGLREVMLAQGLSRDVCADEAPASARALVDHGDERMAEAPRAAEGVRREQERQTKGVVRRHLVTHLGGRRDDAVEFLGVDGMGLAEGVPVGCLDRDVAAHEVHAEAHGEAERQAKALDARGEGLAHAPLAGDVEHARLLDWLGAELRCDGARKALVEGVALLERGGVVEALPGEERTIKGAFERDYA